jgi:agmatine/peptidylarginine deiminase
MLTWPHPQTDWADDLDAVYPVFAQIGAAISQHERLLSVGNSAAHAEQVNALLLAHAADPARLLFCIATSDDSWARDHGPLTTLRDGEPQLHDFVFNGWGGKFDAQRDNRISATIAAQQVFGDLLPETHELVLEGGAIETDGRGTLLATRSSVLTATRNPALDQAGMERVLRRTLGLERFLWLDHGDISGDDTDGHIDTLARFSDPDTILYATAPPGDADHAALAAMADELHALRTADGRPYRLLPLPFPGVHRDADGRRLPATYANFLIINGAVLLPAYAVEADREAQRVLAEAFPAHEIILIDCRGIIRQNGSLHCLTMQFPAALTLNEGQEPVAL